MSAIFRAEMALNEILEQSLAKLEADLASQVDCDLSLNEVEAIVDQARARMTAELPALLAEAAKFIALHTPRRDVGERVQ